MRLLLFLLTLAACNDIAEPEPCARLRADVEACDVADGTNYDCDPALMEDTGSVAATLNCMADYIEVLDCSGTVGTYTDVTAPAYEACAE